MEKIISYMEKKNNIQILNMIKLTIEAMVDKVQIVLLLQTIA